VNILKDKNCGKNCKNKGQKNQGRGNEQNESSDKDVDLQKNCGK
jgi:hypothetical protein